MGLRYQRRRRTQKKKKQSHKTRRRLTKPPNTLINFSPISSPGPNSPVSSNSPITKRAKELAKLYPNRGTMLQRSTSFNNGISTDKFYNEFEKLFPEKNGPAYP